MSMNELASRLNITNGALTSHIKKLENCGLITTSSESAVHGNQKICSIHLDKILIDLEKPAEIENVYQDVYKRQPVYLCNHILTAFLVPRQQYFTEQSIPLSI